MTTLREAAQQALEALEAMTKHFGFARLGSSSLADTMKRGDAHVAMNNLRAALAEPTQEPVEWSHINGTSDTKWHPPQRPAEPQGCDHCNHPLYAAIKCRVCGRAHKIGGEE